MDNPTPRPMHIRRFCLTWIGISLLLWPIVVIPTLIVIVLIDPQFSTSDLTVQRLTDIYNYNLWWKGSYLNDLLVAVFAVVVAFVQDWMFRNFLHIKVRGWVWLTIVGGFIGALLMGTLELPIPFEMTAWFLGISVAQWWAIRKTVKHGWLWVLAHFSASLFFPAYGNTTEGVLLHWTLATMLYAAATLYVLYQLAQDARIDKLKT